MTKKLLMGAGRGQYGSSLLNSLVAHWKLDEASGTRNDSHGTRHLTDNNTVTQNPGKINEAAQFTAANTEYLSRASDSSLQMGNVDFTIACWVYLDTTTTKTIVSKDGAANRDYCLDVGGGQNFRFYLNGGTAIVQPAVARSTATWYFVVAWHDAAGDTVNLQVNNAAASSAGTSGNFGVTGSAEFRVGGRETVGATMDGRIDSLSLWRRVLTADERTALYNSGNGLDYPFS